MQKYKNISTYNVQIVKTQSKRRQNLTIEMNNRKSDKQSSRYMNVSCQKQVKKQYEQKEHYRPPRRVLWGKE